MATIINNPPTSQTPAPSDGGNVVGIILGVVLVVVVIFLFMRYGIPAMRGVQNTNSGSAGTTINVPVPDKINVNVNK